MLLRKRTLTSRAIDTFRNRTQILIYEHFQQQARPPKSESPRDCGYRKHKNVRIRIIYELYLQKIELDINGVRN